jgi:hypothetical protein
MATWAILCSHDVAWRRIGGAEISTSEFALSAMELSIRTVASGWEEVLGLFRLQEPVRIVTRHGVAFDLPGLTVCVQQPNDLSLPANYPYPELVKDYRDRLFGDQRDKSLLYQRLRRWRNGDDAAVDQIDQIKRLLRSNPSSRTAVFSTWQPGEDLSADFPVSPVGGCFRMLEGVLHLFLTGRSVDVVVGLVPDLLAFAQLTLDIALELGVSETAIAYSCWSAHIYELDYLMYSPRR